MSLCPLHNICSTPKQTYAPHPLAHSFVLEPPYFPDCQVSRPGRKVTYIRAHLLSDIEKVVDSLRALIHAAKSPSHGGMLDVSKVEH